MGCLSSEVDSVFCQIIFMLKGEIEKYSNKDNCHSPVDNKYHNEVKALL